MLDVLDEIELLEHYPVLFLVFWVRLCIMNVNQGWLNDRPAHIVDGVDYPHGSELSLKPCHEVIEYVHSSVWRVFIRIPHVLLLR